MKFCRRWLPGQIAERKARSFQCHDSLYLYSMPYALCLFKSAIPQLVYPSIASKACSYRNCYKKCCTFFLTPCALYLVPCTFLQSPLARIIHESVSRDREDGLATGQPQGVESEAYLNSTSQVSSPEDAREDDYIRGRSSRFMNYPG